MLFARKLFLDRFDSIVAHVMLKGGIFARLNGQVVATADHELRLERIGLHFLRGLLAAVDGKDEERLGLVPLMRHVDALDLLLLGVVDRDEIQVPASLVETSRAAVLLDQFVDLLILLQSLERLVVDLLASLQELLDLVQLRQVGRIERLLGEARHLDGLVGGGRAVLGVRLLGLAFSLFEGREDDGKAHLCVFSVLLKGKLVHVIIFICNITHAPDCSGSSAKRCGKRREWIIL